MEPSSAFDLGVRSAQRNFHTLNKLADASRQGAIKGTLHDLAVYVSASDQAFEAFVKFEALKRVANRCVSSF